MNKSLDQQIIISSKNNKTIQSLPKIKKLRTQQTPPASQNKNHQSEVFQSSKKKTKFLTEETINPQQVSYIDRLITNTICQDNQWNKHLNDNCLCNKCNCGKHICKLHPIKLMMKIPKSNYRASFNSREMIQNRRLQIPIFKNSGDVVVDTSNYMNSFKQSKIEKHQSIQKIKSNLKVGGPLLHLTTYNQQYIVKSGPSQKLMVDRSINFPINTPTNGTSNYKATYKYRAGLPAEKAKVHDQIIKSPDALFLGKSSYQNDFQKPSIDQYAQKVSGVRKIEKIIDLPNKKSIYRYEYDVKPAVICPAEIEKRKQHERYI